MTNSPQSDRKSMGGLLMRLRFIFMGYPRARLVLLVYAFAVFFFNLWLWHLFLLILCVPRRSNRKQHWLSRRGHARSFVAADFGPRTKLQQAASPNAHHAAASCVILPHRAKYRRHLSSKCGRSAPEPGPLSRHEARRSALSARRRVNSTLAASQRGDRSWVSPRHETWPS